MAESSDSEDDERERARQQRALLKQRASQDAEVRAQDAAPEEDAGELEERRLEQEQLALQLKAQEDLQRAAIQVRMVMKMKTQASFARSRLAARGAKVRAAAPAAGAPDAGGGQQPAVSTTEEQGRGTVVEQAENAPGKAVQADDVGQSGEPVAPAGDSKTASDASEAGAARAGQKNPAEDAEVVPDEPQKLEEALTIRTRLKLEALPLAMTEEDRLDLKVKEQVRLKAAAAEEERQARELEEGARLKSKASAKEDALNKSAGSALERAEAEACARQQAETAKAGEIRRLLASQEIGQQQASTESAVWRADMELKIDSDRVELAELRAQKEAVEAVREEARCAAALRKRAEEEEEAARLKAAFEAEEERLRALAEETARKERENEREAREKEEAERREREELAEVARKQAEAEREERERKRMAEQQRAREQKEREEWDMEMELRVAKQGQELERKGAPEDISSLERRHDPVGAEWGQTGQDVRVEKEARKAVGIRAGEVNSMEQAHGAGGAESSGLSATKEVRVAEEAKSEGKSDAAGDVDIEAKSEAESEAESEARRETSVLETRLGNDEKLAHDGDSLASGAVRDEVARDGGAADLEERARLCENRAPKQDAASASGHGHEGQTPKTPGTAPGNGGRAGSAEQVSTESWEGGLDEAEVAVGLKVASEEAEATAHQATRQKLEEAKRRDCIKAEADTRAKAKREEEEKLLAEESRAREEEDVRKQAWAARAKAAERQRRLERESLMLERAQLDAEIANLRQSWTVNQVSREGNAGTARVLMAAREALGEGNEVDVGREKRGPENPALYRLLWGSVHATPKMQLDILKHRLRARGDRVQIQGVAGTRWSGPRAEFGSAGQAGPRRSARESGQRRQTGAQSLSPRRNMPTRGDRGGADSGSTHPEGPGRASSSSPYATIPAILAHGRLSQRAKRLVEMQKNAETVVVEAAHVAAPHRRTVPSPRGGQGLPKVGETKTIVRLAPRRERGIALPSLTRRKSGA